MNIKDSKSCKKKQVEDNMNEIIQIFSHFCVEPKADKNSRKQTT